MRQLALIISILILSIEMVLLFLSVRHEEERLYSTREKISKEVFAKTGQIIDDLEIYTLSMKDIDKRLKEYKINIILITLLITFLVAAGTMVIFYRMAGRHIVRLHQVNLKRARSGSNVEHYIPKHIPKNEVGALIESRCKMLDEIVEYEQDLEGKLKEAEARLVQSAKLSLVGEFTAGIIHDIRNPLTVILSYSQMLKKSERRQKMGEEKTTDYVEKIHLGATKLNKLVDRMGSFSRQEEDYKEDIDLIKILENSLLFTESKAKKVGTSISKIFPDGPTPIFGDENALEQIFSNLFSNAYDAMEGKETRILTVSLEEADEFYTVAVNDTGSGMDRDTQASVFDSFFTTKEKGKGTGLGLANVKEIALKHGGEIVLESELGRGTTFSIILYTKDNRPKNEEIEEAA